MKKSVGRPQVKIDWKKVNKLMEAGCSGGEISGHLGIHSDTLYRRCVTDNGAEFSEYIKQFKAKGDTLLRKKQFELALEGDKSMLIWLGKNRLGQSDKAAVDHTSMGEAIKGFTVEVVNNETNDTDD